MECPFCKEDRDKVIDSRSSDGGRAIRRRRQCLVCKRRFTTYERIGDNLKLYVVKKDDSRVPYSKRRFTTYERIGDNLKLYVVKKDNSRVPYSKSEVIGGLQKACYKRAVSAEQIQRIADRAEESIFRNFDKEVPSAFVGESVMKQLRRVDKVAYIRFASVYRDFRDAGELIEEVSRAIAETESRVQPMLFDT